MKKKKKILGKMMKVKRKKKKLCSKRVNQNLTKRILCKRSKSERASSVDSVNEIIFIRRLLPNVKNFQ